MYNVIAMAMIFVPRTFHNPINPATWLVFIFTLLATELAWFWLPLQVLLALFLTLLGGLDSIMGGISLAILAISWLGLVWCISAGFKTPGIIEKALTEGKAYGMNPEFVAVTGGSAGGQLAALMGLTPNRPELQPTYDIVDTSIQACVPLYGAYDLLHRFDQHPHGETIAQFLVDKVFHESPEENPGLWDLASPIVQISDQSPPFMVVHGSHDSICPATDARMFIKHLRKVSKNPVVYAELIGGEHAFDTVHSPRSDNMVDGIHRFLEWTLAQHTAACSSPLQTKKRYENSGG